MTRDKAYEQALKRLIATQDGRDVLGVILERTALNAINPDLSADKRQWLLGRQSIGYSVQNDIKQLGHGYWPKFLKNLEDDDARYNNDTEH